MLLILGAVAVLEAAAILTSAGLCVFKQSTKLKRRQGKHFKADVAYGNGHPAGRKANGGGSSTVTFVSAGGGTGAADGLRRSGAIAGAGDYHAGGDNGCDYGGDDGGTDGGDDGGHGHGGGCGGGGCGGDD